MRRIVWLWIGMAALAARPVVAQAPLPMGHLYGQVINPTGAPQTSGYVAAMPVTREVSNREGFAQTENEGVFQINQNGEFSGDLQAGTYKLIFRLPNTPPDKEQDEIENVVITPGNTTERNIAMSRPEYVNKLSPDDQKLLEEPRKHNAWAMKQNEAIRRMNAGLVTVAADSVLPITPQRRRLRSWAKARPKRIWKLGPTRSGPPSTPKHRI